MTVHDEPEISITELMKLLFVHLRVNKKKIFLDQQTSSGYHNVKNSLQMGVDSFDRSLCGQKSSN